METTSSASGEDRGKPRLYRRRSPLNLRGINPGIRLPEVYITLDVVISIPPIPFLPSLSNAFISWSPHPGHNSSGQTRLSKTPQTRPGPANRVALPRPSFFASLSDLFPRSLSSFFPCTRSIAPVFVLAIGYWSLCSCSFHPLPALPSPCSVLRSLLHCNEHLVLILVFALPSTPFSLLTAYSRVIFCSLLSSPALVLLHAIKSITSIRVEAVSFFLVLYLSLQTLTSAYSLLRCSCGKRVPNVNKCQRLHRDGIKITTPEGSRKVFRTTSKVFRCANTGCPYSADDSGNFQVSGRCCFEPRPS